MMHRWTPETIRFRADAALWHDFDGEIARRIAPRIPPGGRVCDAGCGLGYAALALAEAGFAVTAVDRDMEALSHLREQAALRQLSLDIRAADLYSFRPDKSFDAMLFFIFGDTEKLLLSAREQCRGRLFLLRRQPGHRFSDKGRPSPRRNAQSTARELGALGIPYEKECFRMDMGQPFRCPEDARRFARLHGREDTDLSDCLIQSGRKDFPLFWPAPCELVLFTVETHHLF